AVAERGPVAARVVDRRGPGLVARGVEPPGARQREQERAARIGIAGARVPRPRRVPADLLAGGQRRHRDRRAAPVALAVEGGGGPAVDGEAVAPGPHLTLVTDPLVDLQAFFRTDQHAAREGPRR